MSNVILISGASRGLGRAITEAAVAAGHCVVAGVRSASPLSDLASREPDRLAVVELDVTDDEHARAAVATYRHATAAGRDLLAADERWQALSVSTAAADVSPTQLDPLGSSSR
jgi:NADP-dependent 3-hydroxy acid dehydrogenase YdfG